MCLNIFSQRHFQVRSTYNIRTSFQYSPPGENNRQLTQHQTAKSFAGESGRLKTKTDGPLRSSSRQCLLNRNNNEALLLQNKAAAVIVCCQRHFEAAAADQMDAG